MKTRIISVLLLVLLTLSAVSCAQDVIFHDIAREEKLTASEINGNVYSLVPLQGKLYLQNGNIYTKEKPEEKTAWTKVAKPDGSGNIIRLASDGTCLYAMDENNKVWAEEPGVSSWKAVAENVKELFDNQVMDSSFATSGRVAYITCSDDSVMQLAGTGTPTSVTAQNIIKDAESEAYIKAAVFDGSKTVFSSNSIICAQGGTLYTINNGTKVISYSKDSGASWENSGSVDMPALCICPYKTDKLLVGTTEGYQISTIDSTSKKASNGENSSTNAESLISNNRQIIMIKAFGSSVYAGVVSSITSEYSKLWGWYGSSWNYE